ncbi:MAG TPA: arginine--tRNA ligase [Spirochaetota bacterium]|nr:arginine--tRNA ligase [Spirochaetota bacterium]
MTIKAQLTELITGAIAGAAGEGAFDIQEAPQIKIEYPKEDRFGDYSTPFALESARIFRRSPLDIAAMLKPYIETSPLVQKVEIVKPGFINMFLSLDYLYGILNDVLSEKDLYGRSSEGKPRKVNIEFVSANPTGPLNIVSARAAAVGDTIANLLEASGHSVEREFYVNDYGNQVFLLGKSVLARYRELEGTDTAFPDDGYHGEYIRDIAAEIRDRFRDQVAAITDEDALITFMAEKAIAHNVEGQKKDLEKFNVRFARWFREKTLHEGGDVPKALEFLEGKGHVYEEDGKKVFRSTDYGDDKDRVVLRDDGRPTYFLADIAYHKNKMDRGYDEIIDIWGPDHHGYIARLSGAMKSMGFEGFRILIAQQVNLIMDGELVKMSKRLGNFSTMSELLDDIGTDVARYFFIMRSLDSHLDFDIALAKRQSSENPVFYLQYAHARICSIFREAESRGIPYNPDNASISYLDNPEAIQLLKLMAKFPEEIQDAANTCEPHRISTFLLRLAQGYHKFYTEHRILSDDPEATASYMMLCDGVRIVLRNGLKLLGVSAPERM